MYSSIDFLRYSFQNYFKYCSVYYLSDSFRDFSWKFHYWLFRKYLRDFTQDFFPRLLHGILLRLFSLFFRNPFPGLPWNCFCDSSRNISSVLSETPFEILSGVTTYMIHSFIAPRFLQRYLLRFLLNYFRDFCRDSFRETSGDRPGIIRDAEDLCIRFLFWK